MPQVVVLQTPIFKHRHIFAIPVGQVSAPETTTRARGVLSVLRSVCPQAGEALRRVIHQLGLQVSPHGKQTVLELGVQVSLDSQQGDAH